ncbi:MAG: hypothetical protein K5673_08290 [Lachnospiraceae bacterium]|nr:hypothetical protein [Lachnospiraceae bacterium]
MHNGRAALRREIAKKCTNSSKRAEFSDGTIRYESRMENPSAERLAGVRETHGALTYEDVDKMTELDENKKSDYERIIEYLEESGSEIILFLQPFSVTQCQYSFDQNENVI